MLLTPHLLVGAAIITNVQNPALGLVLVFLSHYFLDLFPHKEYSNENIKNRNWRKSLSEFFKVFLDIALGLLIIFLFVNYNILVLAAMFLAIVADGFTLLYAIFHKNKLLAKHQKLHIDINFVWKNKGLPAFLGVLSQIVVAIIAIYFLL